MRMLDEDNDKKLDRVTLFLTKVEAKELRNSLETLIVNQKQHHVHISTDDYQKELTVCLYDEKKLEGFHERAKKIITEDV